MRQGIGNPHATAEYQAALDKLRDEMAKEAKRPEIGSVGEVMTALLMARPDAAGAILAEGRTLAGAYAALEKYARDNRGNKSCYYIGPDRANAILMDYYHITGDAPEAAPTPAPAPADALDLDALLSGGAGL